MHSNATCSKGFLELFAIYQKYFRPSSIGGESSTDAPALALRLVGFRPAVARPRLRFSDRGLAGVALEGIEFRHALARLASLHGDTAKRAGADRGAAAQGHKNFIGQFMFSAIDPGQCARPPFCRAFAGVPAGASDLGQCRRSTAKQSPAMWQPISTAPFDRDLELAVIDGDGPHALVFACRRILDGWMNAETKERLDVHPSHWREWPSGR